MIDPTKFDFYAMDCYRMLAEDKMAGNLADQVIRASTDFGTERAPMRLAEARITLGVVAARQGDIEGAVHHGGQALNGPGKSLPSLLMVNRDLTRVLGGLSIRTGNSDISPRDSDHLLSERLGPDVSII